MDESLMNEEETVVLRDFDQKRDLAYIYASWRASSYYSAYNRPDGPPNVYFKRKSQEIKEALETAKVKIACLENAPMLIVGYIVWTGTHLDYIFVKPDYRLKGIGALLLQPGIKTVTEELTKIGKVLKDKKNLKFKGEDNANSNGTQSRQADQRA